MSKTGLVQVAEGIGKIVEFVNGLDASKATLLAAVIGAGVGGRVAGLPGAIVGGVGAGAATAMNWDRELSDLEKRRAEVQRLLSENPQYLGGIPVGERMLAQIDAKIEATRARRAGATGLPQSSATAPELARPQPVGSPADIAPNAAPLLPRSARELGNELAASKLLDNLRLQKDSVNQLESAILRMRLERERDEQVVNGAIVDLGPKYTKAQIEAAVAIQKQIEAIQALERARASELAMIAEQAAEWAREQAALAELDNRRTMAVQQIRESIAEIRAESELVGRSTIVWNEHTRQFEAVNVALEEHLALRRMLQANPELRLEDAERFAREQVEAQRQLKTETEKVSAAVERQQATYDFLANMGERAFDRIGDAMVDMAMEGKDAMSSLTNIARSVVASIYADFLKLAIANPLKNALFGGNAPTLSDGGGFFKGLFGGGGYGGPVDAATGLTGTTGLSFGGPRAAGGRVSPGSWYMVGEEGPESFVPDVAGRIFPHDESMAIAGGGRGGDVYQIDARGADREGMRRLETLIQSVNASIERRAVMAVGAEMKRGRFP